MGLLDQIVAHKRAEVDRLARRLPHTLVQTLCKDAPEPRGFKKALTEPTGARVIAEVKRASPSRGVLRATDPIDRWNAAELASAYERGGAAALSVLTDQRYFWGHADNLWAAREATQLPIIRKDFIVSAYQVDESRWLGADAILLIARILSPETLKALAAQAMDLGMDVLVEVHREDELESALQVPGALLGINNRNLSTLEIDRGRSIRLRQQIPTNVAMVAESGLSERVHLEELMQHNVRAFLIGESIASADDPQTALEALLP